MENAVSKIRLFGAVCVVLVLTNVITLLVWKPWDAAAANGRNITVIGQATVKAEPDQFVFTPTYQRATTAEISQLGQDIVKKLKALGVADSAIKINAYSGGDTVDPTGLKQGFSPDQFIALPPTLIKTGLTVSVTLNNKDLAQKVQDYLNTTNPDGALSPWVSFSDAKQKKLDSQARLEAITDARNQADKSAAALKTKIGKVLTVSDQNNGGIYPVKSVPGKAGGALSSDQASLPVQPGTDSVTSSVQVVFALR